MTKSARWEYKTVEIKSKLIGSGLTDMNDQLNALGRQGWELVSSGHDARGFGWFFFFKRQTD